MRMYEVAVQREVIVQHYLIGADFGPENRLHSHAYRVELQLSGSGLDGHGFLADIDAMTTALDEVLDGIRDKTLNDLAEFRGLNPSIEHLARILCRALRLRVSNTGLGEVTVRIWETPSAWAAYRETIGCTSA
jgi:6-pyruvoyltetrahydropterin/6-carboxytetrahydropterin synthase